MINLKKCTYCKYEKNNHFLESKDYSTSKEIFNIVKCEKCNLLYTNPRPDYAPKKIIIELDIAATI